MKFGERVIFDLPENRCIFVPDDINSWLLENRQEMEKMKNLVEGQKIGFERKAGATLLFTPLLKEETKKKRGGQVAIEKEVHEMFDMEAEESKTQTVSDTETEEISDLDSA